MTNRTRSVTGTASPIARRLAAALPFLLPACRGDVNDPGDVTASPIPAAVVREGEAAARKAGAALGAGEEPRQILFGDLHVHTTFSPDAFQLSLPLLAGEGAHPPADACDYARFCSDLDFWAITDHAEGIDAGRWQATIDSIRECNAVTDPADPDVVAFLGWEWTQVGASPDDHYGHRNVIFRDFGGPNLPARPVAAPPRILAGVQARPNWRRQLRIAWEAGTDVVRYLELDDYAESIEALEPCPEGVDTRELPMDCHEIAADPAVLQEKLEQWGAEVMVIPHGTAWGFYTPPGTTQDKQLSPRFYDPEANPLVEVFSGHGSSEEYRDYRAVTWNESGEPVCPEPTEDFEPCCWRAGEIIRSRCGDAPPEECERRVGEARRLYLEAGVSGHHVVPGASIEDWKGCGQCHDCFEPAFHLRPGNTVQYMYALSNFDAPDAEGDPLRFRYGMIASSDNHTARPGTGYKELARHYFTEARGATSAELRTAALGEDPRPTPEPKPFDPETFPSLPFFMFDIERQASFFVTGGLVAVHSAGRTRDAIWGALERREVYGTSGPRILLWFDLLNAPSGELPMGSAAEVDAPPRFRVRAAGGFRQKPGCPAHATAALSPERLAHLCRGECYHPSDERHPITRIEIVKIRPQVERGEPVAPLIEDPWKVLECPGDPAGCVVEFEDAELLEGGREAVYYARAIQEPTPAVNGRNERCVEGAGGSCREVDVCYGDYRTDWDDECLAPVEERAWSSPLFLRPEAADAETGAAAVPENGAGTEGSS